MLEPAKNRIQVTDLTFAIFDELVPAERLKNLRLIDVIRYRKASEKAREEFLEHLSVIQAKQASIGVDGDYVGAIEKLITTEIKPAVQTFKNKLNTIDESLFGAIAKGVIGAVGGSSGVSGARNAAPYIAALLAVAEKGELLKRFENRTITLAAIGARRFGEGGPTDNIPRLGMIPYE